MKSSYDIAVVGAGPCGIAVGAAARRQGLRAVLLDRGCVTSSLVDYPYYMRFFSTAKKLEIGGVPFTIPEPNPSRREALAYYRRVVDHYDLDVRQYHAVHSVRGEPGGFRLGVRRRSGEEMEVGARAVVIATGGFHEPNYLDVEGEELSKVLHYYREPYPFFDQDVLVVGGGNSAVESALELFRNHARVTLVHFEEWIDTGVKPWIVPDIRNRVEREEIRSFWRHRVREIGWDSVTLRHVETGETTEIDNDWVLAMTGWRPNPELLRELGVAIDRTTGIPAHDPETMETDVDGVFVAGVLAAGYDANKIFIENGKEHGDRIVRALAARWSDAPSSSSTVSAPV